MGPHFKLAAAAIMAATGGAVAIADVSSASPSARTASAQTLALVERGGGIKFVDNPPNAQHQGQFSAGDIAIVTRRLYQHGRRAGTLELACLFTTSSSDHCTGTATIGDSTIELAGVSDPRSTTEIAVTGGTGSYAGAHGSAVSRDRPGSADVADLRIMLLP
ncbi:MAG: hypothetical protein KGL15_02875 [Acidobacteriota bacterium]|nr:hypothetical protein [Acidobacteriota bacterium]